MGRVNEKQSSDSETEYLEQKLKTLKRKLKLHYKEANKKKRGQSPDVLRDRDPRGSTYRKQVRRDRSSRSSARHKHSKRVCSSGSSARYRSVSRDRSPRDSCTNSNVVHSPKRPRRQDHRNDSPVASTSSLRNTFVTISDDSNSDSDNDPRVSGPLRDMGNTVEQSEMTIDPDVLQIDNVEELDESVLHMLGEDPENLNKSSFELHATVCQRWTNILGNGLEGTHLLEVCKKYPNPTNCPTLAAPEINPEVTPVLTGQSLNRDKYQTTAQNTLASGISALGAAINVVLKDKTDIKSTLLPLLSDCGRILTCLHHSMSLTRRAFIVPTLNKLAKDVADSGKIDKFLFGEEFGERYKAAKALEQNGKSLKSNKTQVNADIKKSRINNFKRPNSLNRKGPSPHMREMRQKRAQPQSSQSRPYRRIHQYQQRI